MCVAAIGAAATVAGAAMAADAQQSAADTAANAQTNASNAGIAQQNQQLAAVQKLLAPYQQAGVGSLNAQQNLLGLNGNNAQQQAMDGIQNSAMFKGLQQQGNNSILQNASATGGLRGGNTQAALAQFSPQLLNQLLQQQYGQLAGISSIGQNAAVGVGNAGMQTGQLNANLMQQGGAAQAGGALANGASQVGMYNGIASGLGQYMGKGGKFGLGGEGSGNNGAGSYTGTPVYDHAAF